MSQSEYFKKVRIIEPLAFENKVIEIPDYVGEGCVGLELDVVQNSNHDGFSILPDLLMEQLFKQSPNDGSLTAAIWIEKKMWYAGGMPIKADEVEIIGLGE